MSVERIVKKLGRNIEIATGNKNVFFGLFPEFFKTFHSDMYNLHLIDLYSLLHSKLFRNDSEYKNLILEEFSLLKHEVPCFVANWGYNGLDGFVLESGDSREKGTLYLGDISDDGKIVGSIDMMLVNRSYNPSNKYSMEHILLDCEKHKIPFFGDFLPSDGFFTLRPYLGRKQLGSGEINSTGEVCLTHYMNEVPGFLYEQKVIVASLGKNPSKSLEIRERVNEIYTSLVNDLLSKSGFDIKIYFNE